jgi:competence protein ComEA
MKILSVVALSAFLITSAPVYAQDLPDGPGKDVVVKACTSCHDVDNIISNKHTKEEWKAVVDTMIGYGAEITDEQSAIIVDYLTKYFGKEGIRAKVSTSPRTR